MVSIELTLSQSLGHEGTQRRSFLGIIGSATPTAAIHAPGSQCVSGRLAKIRNRMASTKSAQLGHLHGLRALPGGDRGKPCDADLFGAQFHCESRCGPISPIYAPLPQLRSCEVFQLYSTTRFRSKIGPVACQSATQFVRYLNFRQAKPIFQSARRWLMTAAQEVVAALWTREFR